MKNRIDGQAFDGCILLLPTYADVWLEPPRFTLLGMEKFPNRLKAELQTRTVSRCARFRSELIRFVLEKNIERRHRAVAFGNVLLHLHFLRIGEL